MKNAIISFLVLFLLFSIAIHIINRNRNWEDGIIKAERHHLATGKYYNKYFKLIIVTTKGDTIVDYVLEEEAEFEKTYWDDINYHALP